MALQALFIDPRIRDNVFLPMVALMFLVNYFRFYMTVVLNSSSNPLLESANLSYKTLRDTILQHKADMNKEPKDEDDEVDINKSISKIKDDLKFGNAMIRS